ncbi:putative muramidase [Bifidobacterium adolescentis ATCC 15703]|uniref:Muramidase n=1 Tax=Bifidobacterium adolescentis (strain ATCC 15703 / DSM 20083 / NCTC 11814 / E194a) TaxID=367928 RepID=A1A295_BIFAA|nr:putative muramidase [Bifidobacterium adolescentis ATCC 15703]
MVSKDVKRLTNRFTRSFQWRRMKVRPLPWIMRRCLRTSGNACFPANCIFAVICSVKRTCVNAAWCTPSTRPHTTRSRNVTGCSANCSVHSAKARSLNRHSTAITAATRISATTSMPIWTASSSTWRESPSATVSSSARASACTRHTIQSMRPYALPVRKAPVRSPSAMTCGSAAAWWSVRALPSAMMW